MKKTISTLILFVFIFPTITFAQLDNVTTSISYEQWNMPDNIQSMGVLGIHATTDFSPWLYGGLGLYSAVSGEKGGFFGLALEGGVHHFLFTHTLWDVGTRIGGAGGHNVPVGGGLFYEPYAGIQYQYHHFRAELYYSYVDFVYGKIDSAQVGLMLGFALDSRDFETTTSRSKNRSNTIAATSKIYMINTGVKNNSNQPMNADMALLGFEFNHYFSSHFFAFFNFSGAFHGNENGYADELLGLGYDFSLFSSRQWDGILKLAAGSGGGGNVSTGGGFIYNPSAGVEYHFSNAISLELDGGYIAAPEGDFAAKEANLLLKYHLSSSQDDNADNRYWKIRLLNQTYFDPKASDGTINPAMQLLNVDFDYIITHYFYITGQTAFAYIGKNTGGYFSGMLGVGAISSRIKNTPIQLFSEALVGTAGGAGLSIGDGALIEPIAGLQFDLHSAVALQLSTGYLMSLQGQFRSQTLQAGITYQLSQ